ncbi:MAG: YHYH protein [Rhodopseudomonas sp.]|nr:YHYH protein [Rhodopseudomonas sp.]
MPDNKYRSTPRPVLRAIGGASLALFLIVSGSVVTGGVATASAHDVNLHKLPLGDGKISHGPKVGWIWACHIDPQAGGAQRVGPWINERAGTYDLTAKIAVRGSVRWPHKFNVYVKDGRRILSTNDLPDHPTGRFPVSRDDPAYRIDRNPNSIARHDFTIELPAHPRPAAQAHCAPGAVGILLTGVALFNALDAPGRDAVAHEVQDSCHGHPQESGVYHYHSLTNCIADKPGPDGNSPLVGYAIDGFGIYGRYENGKPLSTSDLDACHGRTSKVNWDGQEVEIYHYVATPDFPYTVGCLRGDFSRELVRKIGGPPPRRRGPPGGGPGGFGPRGFGPPPFDGPPPR